MTFGSGCFQPAIPVGNSSRPRIHWTIKAAGIKLVNTRRLKVKSAPHLADNAFGSLLIMRPEVQERKSVQPAEPYSIALERHYSVPEIAELWAMSEKSVRRLFAGENGVLEWGTHETARKRGYLNLRIPESVLIRVHQRRQRAS